MVGQRKRPHGSAEKPQEEVFDAGKWMAARATGGPVGNLEGFSRYSVPDYQISANCKRGKSSWPGGVINTQLLGICWACGLGHDRLVDLFLVKPSWQGINCPPSPSQRHKSREDCFPLNECLKTIVNILLINVITESLNTDVKNEQNSVFYF